MPTTRVNDYAGLLAPADRERLEARLTDRERTTGAQMVIAILPSLDGESLEDFSVRLAERWRVGQKALDNGVILLVFVKDRKARLEVGYGLEGAIPDAIAGQIIRERLAPAFREGRYAAGLEVAVNAVRAELPKPLIDWAGPISYPALQGMFDALYPKGLQWYWKGDFVKALPDAAIAAHLKHSSKSPSEISAMHLYPIDGAVHRMAKGDTAWNCRDATWSMVIVGVDADPGKAPALKKWVKDYWAAVHPFDLGGAYPNFMMDDESEGRLQATYGDNYQRLATLKGKYDPANLFHVNQNIQPAA